MFLTVFSRVSRVCSLNTLSCKKRGSESVGQSGNARYNPRQNAHGVAHEDRIRVKAGVRKINAECGRLQFDSVRLLMLSSDARTADDELLRFILHCRSRVHHCLSPPRPHECRSSDRNGRTHLLLLPPHRIHFHLLHPDLRGHCSTVWYVLQMVRVRGVLGAFESYEMREHTNGRNEAKCRAEQYST